MDAWTDDQLQNWLMCLCPEASGILAFQMNHMQSFFIHHPPCLFLEFMAFPFPPLDCHLIPGMQICYESSRVSSQARTDWVHPNQTVWRFRRTDTYLRRRGRRCCQNGNEFQIDNIKPDIYCPNKELLPLPHSYSPSRH